MLQPLTIVLLIGSAVLGLVATHHLIRRRLIDDTIVIVAALLVVGLLVQLVIGIGKSGAIEDGAERATFIAYLPTVVIVVPVAVYLAIKEKTQWAMGVVLGGAVVVAILVARLQQIWTLSA